MAPYVAANLFLDSFAQDKNRASNFPWISTNWDKWLPEAPADQGQTKSIDIFGMTPAEGFEAFKRITSQDAASQVVVSRSPLNPRLDQWINAIGTQVPVDEGAPEDVAADESLVEVDEPAYTNQIEADIAKIWQEMLGIPKIGPHDNFFELGADSLIFLQVATRLREKYGIKSSIREVFDRNTVSRLAETVTQETTEDKGCE